MAFRDFLENLGVGAPRIIPHGSPYPSGNDRPQSFTPRFGDNPLASFSGHNAAVSTQMRSLGLKYRDVLSASRDAYEIQGSGTGALADRDQAKAILLSHKKILTSSLSDMEARLREMQSDLSHIKQSLKKPPLESLGLTYDHIDQVLIDISRILASMSILDNLPIPQNVEAQIGGGIKICIQHFGEMQAQVENFISLAKNQRQFDMAA
ncbi:MAG TPA: hypothetical protein VJB12_00520 [Candidatus Nanoarchaeia archaeon]|nr:hypothetical protein [Candidatus Nanoarchaeia archaeon]